MAEVKQRHPGMMATAGAQGVGKTYQNMHLISSFVKDKPLSKVRGRKCLIFDTNGEYTEGQFAENGIKSFHVKTISVKDVAQWCRTETKECRRINAKNLGISEKKKIVEYLLQVYINGMFVLEDINTYILSVTHMEEIVGKIVNLRHKGVDIIVSYQSLRAVEPRIWQNSRWVRMHYQADNVMDIKNKVTNIHLFKIAQILVEQKYFAGDKRFFVLIHNLDKKITGSFKKEDLEDACKKYLLAYKKPILEYKSQNKCSLEEAEVSMIKQYMALYSFFK